MACAEEDGSEVILRVRVQPRAARNALRVETDGRIRVALMAPPVDDAANKALCAFIAEQMDVPKRDVTLVRGARSRDKTLRLAGLSESDLSKRLIKFS